MRPDYDPDLYKIRRKRNKMRRIDSPVIGLLAGLVFPLLGLFFLYFFFFSSWNFSTYIKMFVNFDTVADMNNASKMLSLSIIGNLIPFYYFLNRKAYMGTRGVILASFLYDILVVLYKFVWQ